MSKKVKTKSTSEEKSVKEMQTELEENRKQQKKLPKDVKNVINKKVFTNMTIAIVVMLYLFLINIGSMNIDSVTYINDLRVFSMLLITLTIILFEISYKRDSGALCINGIEALILAIFTLTFPYIYVLMNKKFNLIISSISFIFGAYYVGKAILVYIKGKRNYLRTSNDIKQILK